MYSTADYINLFYSLLPPGTAWNRSPDSNTYKLLAGLSAEFVNIDAKALTVVRESNPSTMISYDAMQSRASECGIGAGGSGALLKQDVLAHWSATGRCDKLFFEELIRSYGVSATIEELYATISPFTANSLCTDAVIDPAQHANTIRVTYIDNGTYNFKSALKKFLPAHIRVLYTALYPVFDTKSLCIDRV